MLHLAMNPLGNQQKLANITASQILQIIILTNKLNKNNIVERITFSFYGLTLLFVG